ncbi:TPA_asm: hypothetical protein GND82_001199 [Salmonella enterica subsp. salamae serovar 60:g,m,t:z6]|uniref:RING-type E3 ubiquitin transferase n=1 Tax=Salmonella enterica subsp. houtenae serovar 1,40:z4,z32:- TaxID=1967604 RepID=A0A730ZGX1_SALHO|nr:NEL-type E3 ubiquitin ligase domain-containing protein [Salmonella enterica]HAC6697829.1 hypothetical protein [Salmonella bongori serovar 66:z65:-]HAE2266362.1 hypothetical protein [Salmonella enterica subsp. enterica serovar 1,9,12:-:-]HAE4188650.1 hypothetical protein [Salmonella enterica subsp. houtenae serovar 1,40:z4,z32:-]HAE7512385.1 hypothetical protein [Salmonella enterica subsp. salamae serovar 60:g,m,t:z6]
MLIELNRYLLATPYSANDNDVITRRSHMWPVGNYPGRIHATAPDTLSAADINYYALWQTWAGEAVAGEGEQRDIAVERLCACLADQESMLDLGGLNLRNLPILPACISTLNVSNNNLSALPDLPEGIRDLTCAGNMLTSLPSLPSTLEMLDCSQNRLPELQDLPPTLTALNCSKNMLERLPHLPDTLQSLNCSGNVITVLPGLSDNLQILVCSGNRLEVLPDLPASLQTLDCAGNGLIGFPFMPGSLQTLNCSYNELTGLPPFPDSLLNLDIAHNELRSLPPLPHSLVTFICINNPLHELPVLPPSLQRMACASTSLTALPPLPPALQELHCQNNNLLLLPELPASLTGIDCSNNHLMSVPALPDSLISLECSHNRLETMPALPRSLQYLITIHNPLTTLPPLPESLRFLNCSNNRLTALPDLPDTLDSLYCYANRLETLPALPDSLQELGYSGNPLTTLPELPASLIRVNNDGSAGGAIAPPSFIQSIGYWFPASQRADILPRFEAVASEENADIFSDFLNRLRYRYRDSQYESFRSQVKECLIRMADKPELREKLFLCAYDSTLNCDDRISLTWNMMRVAEMAFTVEQEGHEGNLPEIIDIARQVFRIEELADIADKKIKQIQRNNDAFHEDLEVILGLQTQLRDALQLTRTAPDMYFFRFSHLTEIDVKSAERQVRAAENRRFESWLNNWEPWQIVLKRIDPPWYEIAENEKYAFIDSPEFEARMQEKLTLHKVPPENHEAASITLGPIITAEKIHEIFVTQTRKILAAKGHASLLEPVWTE